MDVLRELQGRRTLMLPCRIDEKIATDLRYRLLELSLESDEEIRLVIDSDGGYSEPSLSITDMIASITAPVIGIVIGKCYSMAVVILQACRKRLAL
jgi:ATP-dependent Clp protease protease subunit